MQCVLVYFGISAQFTLEMCVAGRNRAKSLTPLILKVQGRSRSSMLISIKTRHLCFLAIFSCGTHFKSNISMPICNHSYARRASSGKLKSFLVKVHLFYDVVWGRPPHPTKRN